LRQSFKQGDMKKSILLTTLFIAMISAGSHAQTFNFGVKAGVNLSKWEISGSGQSVSTQNLTGFHVGGVADVKFGSFSVQPAVLFTTKGGSQTTEDTQGVSSDNGSAYVKTRLKYLEIPLNLLYRVKVWQGDVFFGGGPYVAFGLSGKSTADANFGGQQSHLSQDLKFGGAEDELATPETGVNALIGYQLKKGPVISAGYGWGLSNTLHGDAAKLKNKGFEFSLGYFFR